MEVGNVGIGTFKKLMSSLVKSSMSYGAGVFSDSRGFEADTTEGITYVLWCWNLAP